jgi:hypothetical protein
VGPDGADLVLQHSPLYRATADDPEQAEYFVRVKWLHAVDAAHAFNEVGLFGNQNTVCNPEPPSGVIRWSG